MSNHRRSFGPNRRVATGSRNKPKSRILRIARMEYAKHRAHMPVNIDQSSARIVNSVAKGASMSNHVVECTLKGMKQPIAPSSRSRGILMEKRKSHSMPAAVGKAKLKEPHAKRKGDLNDASPPTPLKAMLGLVPKTTNRLDQYSDSSSRLRRQAISDRDITSAKYNTAKLEWSAQRASKDGYTIEGNDKKDEMMIDNDKENVKFGEYHKEGDTRNAKHTLGSILSDIHCNSMGQFANSKKRKELSSKENPDALDDDSNVEAQVDNMSYKQMKKLKQSRVTWKGEGDSSGDINHLGLEDDTTSILKFDQAKVAMPSCVEQQCYSCSNPIDKLTWSGILKIDDKKYVSLDGHLSTKSCEKAWNLSGQLLKVVEVKKLLRLEVWPKAWEVSTPTGDDIGIYFFSHEMRQEESLDQLVREVIQNDLALQAIIGEAEMLIFPSTILPNQHQTFQGKHYLWGVFKRRDKGVVVQEPLNVVARCEMENHQNVVLDQPNLMLPGEDPNQEMIQMVSVVPLETRMLLPNKNTQEVEACHLKWPTNKGFDLNAHGEEGAQAEATPVTTDAATFPASHEQVNPSMGHSADKLMGFVIRKTPKLDRIIRELEEEGALVFAMQGEMVGAGSWVGSKASATQK